MYLAKVYVNFRLQLYMFYYYGVTVNTYMELKSFCSPGLEYLNQMPTVLSPEIFLVNNIHIGQYPSSSRYHNGPQRTSLETKTNWKPHILRLHLL
jgi:hypothetical protein